MTYLADALIRSTLVLLAGLGAAFVLRRRSSALRHWVLVATIAASALAAPLSWALPEWTATAVPAPAALVFEATPATAPATTATAAVAGRTAGPRPLAPAAPARTAPLGLIWALGFGIGAGALLLHVLRLARLSARAAPVTDDRWVRIIDEVRSQYGIREAVPVLRTPSKDLLATWGFFRPCILVPDRATRWSDELIRVVVCHELAHIRRYDWAVQIATEVLRRAYWFQPLMWIACRAMRRESEQACDDVVLGAGVEAPAYAGHLLQIARAVRSPYGLAAAVPMARPSTLERRIAAMLNTARNRRPLSHRALIATTLALAAATFTAAAVHPQQDRTAQLTGTIYDGSGGVLPGVAVTLTAGPDRKAQTTTDASGRFRFPASAGEKYVLEAALPGFNAFRQELELNSAGDWDHAITLQVGKLTETIVVTAKREPATQPAPGAPKPAPVRVGGNIKVPTKLVNVNPVYPPSMRAAGRTGVVPLDALIGSDGSVVFVRVVSANVHPDFADAAIEAVRQWKFSPTLLNGKPVEVFMGVTIKFGLE